MNAVRVIEGDPTLPPGFAHVHARPDSAWVDAWLHRASTTFWAASGA